jgi:excisionase family DNA binding protein
VATRAQPLPIVQLELPDAARAEDEVARAAGSGSASARPVLTRAAGGQATFQRLAVSPDEAAALLGVSSDYLDEHVIPELRVVRRGRRVLIAVGELQRWLARSAVRGVVGRG